MPKNLEDIEEKILEEARRQVFENGYENTSIRTIAKACHIAVGTIYNYYESKDFLIASFMIKDWMISFAMMQNCCAKAESFVEACEGIYLELQKFEKAYEVIFRNKEAVQGASRIFGARHQMLRDSLAGLLQGVITRIQMPASEFLAEFASENILTWSNEGVEFERLRPMLARLAA